MTRIVHYKTIATSYNISDNMASILERLIDRSVDDSVLKDPEVLQFWNDLVENNVPEEVCRSEVPEEEELSIIGKVEE